MLSCVYVCTHCLTMSSTHENESMTFKATTTFCVRTATAASISSNANQVWNINLTFCYFCTEWNEEGKNVQCCCFIFHDILSVFLFLFIWLACLMLWWIYIFFKKKYGMKIYFIYKLFGCALYTTTYHAFYIIFHTRFVVKFWGRRKMSKQCDAGAFTVILCWKMDINLEKCWWIFIKASILWLKIVKSLQGRPYIGWPSAWFFKG